jgi:outer membrane protein OmpA-like peptidoglycan-associated protein
MKHPIIIITAGAALALAIGLGWISWERTRALDRRLQDAKREAETLRQSAQNYARKLDRALQLASAAGESAEAAARRALEAGAARIIAEKATISAEDRTQAAEKARKEAEAEAQQSREALTAIEKRREQELNRMHEALARIAATRRTDTGMVIELANDSFRFDFNKASLRPENREILSRIAGVLLVSNGYRLFVHGHTDDVGSPEYNQLLSERRAASVASYLVTAGVDSGLIETRAFGKTSPRVEGRTSKARQENRRVEIVLVDSVIQYSGEVSSEGSRSALRSPTSLFPVSSSTR